MPVMLIAFLLLVAAMHPLQAQPPRHEVRVVGAMRNVMWKGQLYGNIWLDTIANKRHLYGLGPVEYLSGEILIIDGQCYKSRVLNDTSMAVEQTYDLRAPFFGYSHIENWQSIDLPDTITTIPQLEAFLDKLTQEATRPFMFKMSGRVEEASIHVVNLPKGATVSSPDEAHQGLTNYQLANVKADIVGFFSTQHKAILTHHDTFLHLHLITADRQKMGHLDEVNFVKGEMKLYLPVFK